VSNIAVGKEFLFIRITVLREYLEREFSDLKNYRGFKFDLERAIDDWVFMCFFVGNDFLPHLPSLEIRENAIDRLIRLYKDFIPTNNAYLTENGFVDVRSVKVILSELGKVEDEIFRNRKEREKADRERQKQRAKRSRIEDYKAPSYIPEQLAPTVMMPDGSIIIDYD
jgi:5'-3' exoribonuclease 2